MAELPCDGCRFHWNTKIYGGTEWQCRRYPAVRQPDGYTQFPRAVARCGEFQENPRVARVEAGTRLLKESLKHLGLDDGADDDVAE